MTNATTDFLNEFQNIDFVSFLDIAEPPDDRRAPRDPKPPKRKADADADLYAPPQMKKVVDLPWRDIPYVAPGPPPVDANPEPPQMKTVVWRDIPSVAPGPPPVDANPAESSNASEDAVAREMQMRWQDRGPPPPADPTEKWKGQKYRPSSERWGNSGGKNRLWYQRYYSKLKEIGKTAAGQLADQLHGPLKK